MPQGSALGQPYRGGAGRRRCAAAVALVFLAPGLTAGRSSGPAPAELATRESAAAETAAAETDIAAADALWESRAQGQRDGRPAPGPIESAVAAYERLLAAEPESLAVRWKLMRALHFLGENIVTDPDEQLAIYEWGRDVGDEAREMLLSAAGLDTGERDPETVARALGTTPDAVETYFYSTVLWGLWGRSTGTMKAARQGVAGRIRDYAQTVVLLDELYADAGGLRVLGRLHTKAPKIPLVTGWIDRDRAVFDLERACDLAPDNPENQIFLADALLQFARDRRDEAISRLELVLERGPRPDHVIEDLAALADAREILERHRGT